MEQRRIEALWGRFRSACEREPQGTRADMATEGMSEQGSPGDHASSWSSAGTSQSRGRRPAFVGPTPEGAWWKT